MPWCGYHPLMETGLKQFGKGLVKAIQARAERLYLPLSELANLEQEELQTFSNSLAAISGGPNKVALEGLTNFVRGIVIAAAARQGEVPFDTALEEQVQTVANLIQPLETEFQRLSGCRNNATMHQLAEWVAMQ